MTIVYASTIHQPTDERIDSYLPLEGYSASAKSMRQSDTHLTEPQGRFLGVVQQLT